MCNAHNHGKYCGCGFGGDTRRKDKSKGQGKGKGKAHAQPGARLGTSCSEGRGSATPCRRHPEFDAQTCPKCFLARMPKVL
jgi:hypothetical protein